MSSRAGAEGRRAYTIFRHGGADRNDRRARGRPHRALDVVRGVAVGGILLANIFVLFGLMIMPADRMAALPSAPADAAAAFFERLFVEGRFDSIFSLLAGVVMQAIGFPMLGIGYAAAVAIIAFQIPFSALWLRRFRYGPVEWIWRRLTYGHPI